MICTNKLLKIYICHQLHVDKTSKLQIAINHTQISLKSQVFFRIKFYLTKNLQLLVQLLYLR